MDWSLTIGNLSIGVLDIIALVIVLVGAISGCITGFARQVANLAGFVLAIPAALLFTRPIAVTLSSNTGLPLFWASFFVFVALSLLVFILVGIFGSALKNVLETVPALDHVLGFVWGLVASAICLSLIIAILNFQSFFDISRVTGSSIIVRDLIEPLFPTLVDAVKGI